MSILDYFRIDGRAALLIGAGKGMGARSALALAEAGADVAIAARTSADLESTAQKVTAETGRRAIPLVLDANDATAMQTVIDQAVAELGRLDIVVSIVGGTGPGRFLETSDEAYAEAFQGNVINGLRAVRLSVPHMLKTDGDKSIVLISTGLGHIVGRGWAVYGAAKAAVEHSVRMLAVELNPRIRVNAVAPGATWTDGFAEQLEHGGIRETLERNTPLRRIGTVEDMAAAVLYLSSPAGSFVTGHVVPVDGGLIKSNLEMEFADL